MNRMVGLAQGLSSCERGLGVQGFSLDPLKFSYGSLYCKSVSALTEHRRKPSSYKVIAIVYVTVILLLNHILLLVIYICIPECLNIFATPKVMESRGVAPYRTPILCFQL